MLECSNATAIVFVGSYQHRPPSPRAGPQQAIRTKKKTNLNAYSLADYYLIVCRASNGIKMYREEMDQGRVSPIFSTVF